MLDNLKDYFMPEHEYYLQNICYNRLDVLKDDSHNLDCTDNISVMLQDEYVIVVLERELKFDPKELFELSVSFGAKLKLKEDKRKEIDWSSINLAEEFHKQGEFVLANLMSRISLLIAQITSSFGQQPLILPTTLN